MAEIFNEPYWPLVFSLETKSKACSNIYRPIVIFAENAAGKSLRGVFEEKLANDLFCMPW
jgi:hypothetical protein